MIWSAELTLSPYVKKVKSGFGEYRMVDEHNAIKAMEQHAKERAIAFVKFVNTQPLWNDAETSLNTIYEKFILEWNLSTQKE